MLFSNCVPQIFAIFCAVFNRAFGAYEANLTEIWTGHEHPHRLHKWLQYAQQYMNHFPKPSEVSRASPLRLLEIGVQSGGSLIAWKRYYVDAAIITGIDIDERCMRSHDPANRIHVEIGSQMNTTFLQYVCDKHGPFDVIIDDGGHTDGMITTSLHHLFPRSGCLRSPGVYAIEDLHVMVMDAYMKSASVTVDIIGRAYMAMHRYWNRTKVHYDPIFGNHLAGMHLYDSIIFLQKAKKKRLIEISKGADVFSNDERTLNPPGTYHDS